MKFLEVAEFFEKIEKTSSRNEMTEMVADFLKNTTPTEAKYISYFFIGRIAPKFKDVEFNLSRNLIQSAIEKSFSIDKNELKKLFGELGDMGLLTEKIMSEKSTSSRDLEIGEVFEKLLEISEISGKGSVEEKQNKLIDLIKNLSPKSAKYVVRIIIGELRLGLSDKTLLDSFSWMIVGDKSIRKLLDKAFGNLPDIGRLAEGLKQNKDYESYLKNIHLEPGTPVASKLVEREKLPEKVWERMPNCIVQPKLDGLRGQIHFDSKDVHIFSRNMETMTDQFPEIIKSIKELGVDSIILDSEIIGFDNGEYLTYQETMQRKRKYDIGKFSKDFPVKAMCFDILFLNGEDLTNKSLEKRIQILSNLMQKKTDGLEMLETKQMKSLDELTLYFEDNINLGLEGIITKEFDSIYEPGTRNYKWIKLKANTKSELVDTIDVVVMGYYSGRGQRSEYGVGSLLTGVYDPEKDLYYTIGKVGSGIKDDAFEEIKRDLDSKTIDEKPENYVVNKILKPDFWIRPEIILEIDADEITRSPSHTAGIGIKTNLKKDKSDRGLSVRFPRIKIWGRDKDFPNTVSEIVKMYELRKTK